MTGSLEDGILVDTIFLKLWQELRSLIIIFKKNSNHTWRNCNLSKVFTILTSLLPIKKTELIPSKLVMINGHMLKKSEKKSENSKKLLVLIKSLLCGLPIPNVSAKSLKETTIHGKTLKNLSKLPIQTYLLQLLMLLQLSSKDAVSSMDLLKIL